MNKPHNMKKKRPTAKDYLSTYDINDVEDMPQLELPTQSPMGESSKNRPKAANFMLSDRTEDLLLQWEGHSLNASNFARNIRTKPDFQTANRYALLADPLDISDMPDLGNLNSLKKANASKRNKSKSNGLSVSNKQNKPKFFTFKSRLP